MSGGHLLDSPHRERSFLYSCAIFSCFISCQLSLVLPPFTAPSWLYLLNDLLIDRMLLPNLPLSGKKQSYSDCMVKSADWTVWWASAGFSCHVLLFSMLFKDLYNYVLHLYELPYDFIAMPLNQKSNSRTYLYHIWISNKGHRSISSLYFRCLLKLDVLET